MHKSDDSAGEESFGSCHSVSHWLMQLKAGDPAAAQPLWERYFHRLVELARQRLTPASRRAADEEDAALSAFDSFFRARPEDDFHRSTTARICGICSWS